VIDADAQTVTRVGGRTFATGDTPLDLVSSDGELWVAGGEPGSTQFRGPQVRSIARVDARGAVRAKVPLPTRAARPVTIASDALIARTPGAVWVIGRDGAVVRVDAATEEVRRTLDLRAHAIAADGDHLWVLTGDGTVLPLDADGEQGAPVSIELVAPGALAADAGSAWVTDAASGALWAVKDGKAEQLPQAAAPGAIAYAAGALWLAQPDRRELQRYDLDERRVTGTVRLRGRPRDLAADGNALWVTVGDPGGVAEACGSREGGEGPLVVVDLPLRAGDRSAAGAIADAVAETFRHRGFRAGSHRAGLRLCDDSTARTGNADPDRCRANAEAYAADRSVVAMIGPLQSACAHHQLEPAAQAPGGPLAIVSPTNTDPLLTRDVRPARRGAYVRLSPRDDRLLAAAARALFAQGHRRVFVLADGPRGSYGVVSAAYFEAGMRRSGLRRAGYAVWRGRSPGAVAARVRRARPDLVFVSGLLDTGAADIIRAVRRALPGVTIAGGEGLLPVSSLFRAAGPAARGVLIAAPFADSPAKLATLAADLVLDAIARSDGSRAGVAAAVRTAPGIDANGDRRAAAGALVRARRGGGSAVNGSTEGAERVSRLGPG
jgi:ABC-type branched-subunit amino acid transport system substrate-binding protein